MMSQKFKVGDRVKVLTSKLDTDRDITGVVVEVINAETGNACPIFHKIERELP